MLFGRRNEAVDQSVEYAERQFRRRRQTEQTSDRRRPHRRQIGEVHDQCPTTDAARRLAAEAEMDVLDLGIHGEYEFKAGPRSKDRRIVTDSERPVVAGRAPCAASDAINQGGFTDIDQSARAARHGAKRRTRTPRRASARLLLVTSDIGWWTEAREISRFSWRGRVLDSPVPRVPQHSFAATASIRGARSARRRGPRASGGPE